MSSSLGTLRVYMPQLSSGRGGGGSVRVGFGFL
jgi:hypothetical protein